MGMYWKVLCNDGTQDVGDPTKAPCVNNGGIKPLGWEGWAKSYFANVSNTPVLCKDGTTQNQLNDPNARVMDACRNNGGRAIIFTPEPVKKAPPPPLKSRDSIFKKIAGSYNQNLIIGVVLVAGYFAYKKFKK